MLDTTNESELYALLRVIDGTDFPYTKGLRSFPDATTEHHASLHRACLELESRGLIRRHYEESPFILDTAGGPQSWTMLVWMPVETAVTD